MDRPSGTVTFLFTDIVGSTRAWESHPQEMRAVLAEHERILRVAFDRHGGYVFATGGDSFSVAFIAPDQAVQAALEGQGALNEGPFEAVGGLAVRMAIHTGLAEERDGDYFGPPLNRVGRMLSVAQGGQIVVSQTVADMVRYALPGDAQLRDLGKVQLKDVSVSQHLWEVTTTDVGTKLPKRTAVTAVMAFAVIAAAIAVFFPAGNDPETTPTTDTAPSTSTANASIPSLWHTQIDGEPLNIFTVGSGVYVAYRADVAYRLAAYDGYTGTPRWEHATADGPARYISTDAEGPSADLATNPDGSYLYVVSGAWLEVLHPDGEVIPRCATKLPLSLAGVAVDARGIYVLSGSTLHLVKNNPGGSLCLEIRGENTTAGRGALPVFGPFVAGNLIVTGDGLAVYGWDADSLRPKWQFPAIGSLPVKGLQVEYRQEFSVQGSNVNQTAVLVHTTDLADPEAPWKFIHLDPDRPPAEGELGNQEVDRLSPAVLFHDLIGVVEPSGDLVFYDLNLEVEASRFHGPIRAAISTNSFVVIATETSEADLEGESTNSLRWLRPREGTVRYEVVLPTGPIRALSGSEDLIHVLTEDGHIYSFPTVPGTTPQSDPYVRPPLPTANTDPIAAVEALHDALNSGSVQRTKQHLAVGALANYGIPDGTLWSGIYRQEYWEPHVEADGLLGARWTVTDCTSAPRTRGGPGVLVKCRLTFTNDVRDAAGEPPVTQDQSFAAYNGLIYEFGERSSADKSPALDALDEWLQENYLESWDAFCRGEAGGGTFYYGGGLLDVECARFRAEHLEEWAASLGG